MTVFSPYCDPSDGFVYANLAVTIVAGSTIGFFFVRAVLPIVLRRVPSIPQWLCTLGLFVFPFVAASLLLLAYDLNPYFPGSAECGDTSEYATIPIGNAFFMMVSAAVGVLAGVLTKPRK